MILLLNLAVFIGVNESLEYKKNMVETVWDFCLNLNTLEVNGIEFVLLTAQRN